MERNFEKEAKIQRSMPKIEVPAIKFISQGKILYVQMNIKSWIIMSPNSLSIYQGFLFAVEPRGISLQTSEEYSYGDFNLLFEHKITDYLPIIRLVGDFPILFHPHFTGPRSFLSFRKSGEWIDYIEKPEEKDIGSYILRVARSLKYEDGYVNPDPDPKKNANPEAAKWYERERKSGKFPTDDVQLPSGKTFDIVSNENFQVQNKPKFQLTSGHTPLRRAKFEIKDFKPPYSPVETKKTHLLIVKDLNSQYKKYRCREDFSRDYEFYLTMNAFCEIKQHIGWGKRTDENRVEQGGILLGHAFRDTEKNLTYAIAEQAIPGRLAIGNAAYLEVTHETWKEMLDDVDRLGAQLQVIGWYHTHPNDLAVFMSGTDRATQERLFGNDWQFAIVLNPHKQIWRAFYGANSCECRGHVLASMALTSA